MKQELHFDLPIHFLMALCGGFLGAYAIFNRMAVFANAQTANLIELIGDLVGRDFTEGMIRLGAFLTFAFGIVLSVFLERRLHRKLKYLEIFVELGVVFLVGFFPAGLHPILAVYPIFFIAALQWCVFPGADGFTAANVFSTNNVKQTVASFTEYLMERRKNPEKAAKTARKARFFGGTLLSFHSGVLCGYIGSLFLGLKSIWLCMIPLLSVLLLLFTEDRKRGGHLS